jgi:SpoIID/LytB domain protein
MSAMMVGFWLGWSVLLSAAPVVEDEVGLLYSSQLQFDPDGAPVVSVGLMEEQPSVDVSGERGLEIAVREPGGDRRIITRPGERVRIEPGEVVPAEVAYWCAVENIPFSQRERLDPAVARWRERGERPQVFEMGSVFGIQGHVIDNRSYILGIRAFASEAEAEAFAQQVFSRFGSRTFVHPHLVRRPAGTLRVSGPRGLGGLSRDLVRIRGLAGEPVTVHRVEFGRGYRWHGHEDRRFPEQVLVTIDRGGRLVVVNRLPVDRLLQGLLPAEMFPSAPMEALKAQAVVARGEVLAKIGSRHFLDPYQLCAQTHCQVYAGVQSENARASRAVAATRGELLFFGSELVDSVYSACCGGHTEDNDAVWAQPPSPALRGRPDMEGRQAERQALPSRNLGAWLAERPPAYCARSSFNRPGIFRWEQRIPAARMDELVARTRPLGRVVSIQVLERGVSGRVKVVRVVGTAGDLVVQREWPIRQLFGNLKSGMFEVQVELDAEQMPAEFVFRGGGWGHGSGMCQLGAIGMAENGHTYREILAHYYNGAEVVRLYAGAASAAREEPAGPLPATESGTPLTSE